MNTNKARFLVVYLLAATVLTGYLFYSLAAAKPFIDTSKPPVASCQEGATSQGASSQGLDIITTALADGMVGTPYQQTLQPSGGTAPLNWSVMPTLPASLALDRATGQITGTPTAPAAKTTYKFTVTDSAKSAASVSKELSLEIASLGLYPRQVNTGSAAEVTLSGCHLQDLKVRVNGTEHIPLSVAPTQIRIGLTTAEVASIGTVLITLSNASSDIGSVVLNVVPASVEWKLFVVNARVVSLEAQLILLVLFIGAFASCVYTLKSLGDYAGKKSLSDPWFTFYLIQPFEGAGVALLMYLLIRGGFLTGTGADIKAVNLFGMCAIAGLAGAFSDTALLKLFEVFQTLFKPTDNRPDKIGQPSITTTALADGTVGTPYQQTLQASGGTAPLKWSVTPALPAPLTLEAATGKVTGTPAAPAAKATFKFTVTDSAVPAASVSKDLTLEIKAAAASGLNITTAALSDGTVGVPYQETLQVGGGTAPLKWSVTPVLPTPLTLDAATGKVTGTPDTPAAKATFKFTVTDSAASPMSANKELTLEIKAAAASGLNITTTALADGTVGAPYQQSLQVSGGTAPLKWSVTPALPAPLTLEAATGKVTGTPTAPAAKATFKFTVADSAVPAVSVSKDLALEITSASPGGGPLPPRQDDDEIDGCDVAVVELTADEDLPATEGGVA